MSLYGALYGTIMCLYRMAYGMPREGYESVSVPIDDYAKAQDYKPAGVTWGECLVAGAERLNDNLDSDTSRFGDDELPPGLLEMKEATDEQLEEIKRRMEELSQSVPERTADEVEGRMR